MTLHSNINPINKQLPILLYTVLVLCFYSSKAQSIVNYQVSSNVLSEQTTIYFSVVMKDTLTIKLYNRWGHVIKTYFDKTVLPIGSYAIKADDIAIESGTYYLMALAGDGKKYPSSLTKLITTVQEIKKARLDVILYPNPTTNIVNIPIEGNKKITILDAKGTLLKEFFTTEKTMSMLQFANGTYLVTVFSENNSIVATQKVLLNK